MAKFLKQTRIGSPIARGMPTKGGQWMGKYKIEAHERRCTCCLRCQLACSDLYTKVFNFSNLLAAHKGTRFRDVDLI
ncbi:MAG: hypothetical protein MUO68_19560 [Desulfobacteraceae bacterium]|nr:hypothetical protein [Desulfobacteraceae bacterium]